MISCGEQLDSSSSLSPGTAGEISRKKLQESGISGKTSLKMHVISNSSLLGACFAEDWIRVVNSTALFSCHGLSTLERAYC